MPASHCPACGTPFPADTSLDEEGARTCAACGHAEYLQLKVGAAAILEQGGRILLLRRSEDPFRGRWGLPAGFVRWNESPETAAVRETQEECRLSIRVRSLAGAYFFDDDPRGNGLLIVYLCDPEHGRPSAGSETSEVGFFSADGLPSELAGSGQDQAIYDWAERRRLGP